MENKKTIYEWFDQDLPEPYRSQALEIIQDYDTTDIKVESLYDALKSGFVWNYTAQEQQYPGYWARLSIRLKRGLI